MSVSAGAVSGKKGLRLPLRQVRHAKRTSIQAHLRYSDVRRLVNRPFSPLILDAEGAPSTRILGPKCAIFDPFWVPWLTNSDVSVCRRGTRVFRLSARRSHGNWLFCSEWPPGSNVCVCRRDRGGSTLMGPTRTHTGALPHTYPVVRDGGYLHIPSSTGWGVPPYTITIVVRDG